MDKKRLAIQVLAATLLYVVISLILEKEYTYEIILGEVLEGLIFGLLYGVFIWFRERLKKKKE
jgi:undecaprenyl pyrophosphate phosphatase UppP